MGSLPLLVNIKVCSISDAIFISSFLFLTCFEISIVKSNILILNCQHLYEKCLISSKLLFLLLYDVKKLYNGGKL